MIFDSHCHTWQRWPYEAGVSDAEQRGTVEALLDEMDRHEVQRAAVVCARIGSDVDASCDNDDNNEYVAAAVSAHPERLVMIADVDSCWLPEHHQPGAEARLRAAASRYDMVGFTHYVEAENDGWMRTDDGRAFFAAAAELNLIASLAVAPTWFSDIAEVARDNPTLPFLLHNLGSVEPFTPDFEADLASLLELADAPNVHLKVGGFHYLSEPGWDFPFDAVRERLLRPALSAFGPSRLAWGSDFSAGRRYVTYTQSLEVLRSWTAGDLGEPDLDRILGGTLEELLRARPAGAAVAR